MNPLETILARLAEIGEELETLNTDSIDEDGEARFTELSDEFTVLDEERVRIVARNAAVEAVRTAAADPRNTIAGAGDPYGSDGIEGDHRTRTPFDMDTVRTAQPGDLRHMALDAIEQASGFRDSDREVLTRWIDDVDEDTPELASLARHIIVTSAPEYRRNWIKAFKAAARGGSNPEAVQYLSRAMSLTDNAGGYAVPQDLDPALILTSDGSTNPIRNIARKVVTTSDTWNGLSTTHAGWSNDAESAEVSDDATTYAYPAIPVHKAQVFIPFSVEIGMDYPGFTDDLRAIIAGGKDDLDATNFVTGTGSGQPTGIVTALTGGSSLVASATADTFATADVYAVETALAAKYRGKAKWTANKAIYNSVRQFDTSGGAAMWERIGAGQPNELLGYAAFEASAFDGTITAAADNYVMCLADWQNYVIVDRVGMSLELIPHLFATANNRPSGQRGFYGFARTGADSVNDGGFSMLNVT